MRKKINCSILITLLLAISFFTGYSKFSYADNPIGSADSYIGETYQNAERGLSSIFLYLRTAGIKIGSSTVNGSVNAFPVAYKIVSDFANSPFNLDGYSESEIIDRIGENSGFLKNLHETAINNSNFKYDHDSLYLLNQIYNFYVDGVRVDQQGEGQLKVNGLTEGYGGINYSVFKFNGSAPYDDTDFTWGSCSQLGYFGYLNVTGKASTCTTPWGRETMYKSVTTTERSSKIVQGNPFDWEILYNEVNSNVRQITAPCLILINRTVYKGGVYYSYTDNNYHLSYSTSGVYKTLPSADLSDFDWGFLNTSDPYSSNGSPSDTYIPPAVRFNPDDPTSYPNPDSPIFDPKYYTYDIPTYTPNPNTWGDPVGDNPMLPDVYREIGINPANPVPQLPDPENDIFNQPDDEPTTITPNTPNAGGSHGTDTIGGGGGSDNPLSSDGTINFPNFDFNLPNINWSIGDVKEKFPFSIPFDLVAFYTVLNAEPQAPAIDRTIPLGFTDWHFEADFSQFENYATIIRNVEYIGFCVFLIYLTIRFVKG